MLPFSIFKTWLLGLLGIGVIGVGGYLLYDWYFYDRDRQQMYWSFGMLVVALGSQWLARPMLGGLSLAAGPTLPKPEILPIVGYRGTRLCAAVYRNTNGPVYILTHGWSLNQAVWQYVVQGLLGKGEIVTWDLRGLGRSMQAKDNDYSLDAMAHDLAAIVKFFKQRPIIIVGHSIGGMICQTFCRLYPDKQGTEVLGMVLVGTTYTNPVKTVMFSSLARALQKPLLEPLLYLTIWLSPLIRLMNISSYLNGSTHSTTRWTSFAGRQTWHQLDLACRLSAFSSPAVVARGMLAMLRFDEQVSNPQITVPSLVIGGINDRLTICEASQRIAADIPGAKILTLEPAGHMSPLERWEAVSQAIGSQGFNAKKPLIAETV